MNEETKEITQEKADFLIWIGGCYYENIDEYVRESAVQGACRRIAQYVSGMVKGQSRIYLAHQQKAGLMADKFPISRVLKPGLLKKVLAVARKLKSGKMLSEDIPEDVEPYIDQAMEYVKVEDSQRVIFGFYLMQEVEFLYDGEGKIPDKVKELVDKGLIKLVEKKIWKSEAQRRCGYRHTGHYVVSNKTILDTDLADLGLDGSKVDVHGPLVVYKQPIETEAVAPGRKPNRGVTKLTEDESMMLSFESALTEQKEVV